MKDTQQNWPVKNIAKPLKNDILLGRGGSSIKNDANVRYRTIVKGHKKAYQTFTRYQKTQLAESLVQEWQDQTPSGRFLELDAKTSTWYCISEKSARRKTSQLLREGAPKIRRQLKAESLAKSPTPISPPPVMRTPSPAVTAPTTAPPPPPNRMSRGPTRTSASKQAKAKLRAKTPASTSVVVNSPPATPNRPIAPRQLQHHSPRMATPSPQMFQTPPPTSRENWPAPAHSQHQRWQQWGTPYSGYGMSSPTPYHYHYVTPAASAPATAPLQPITPADTNQRSYYSNVQRAIPTKPTSGPKPILPKPALLERKVSSAKPAPLGRQSSTPSPESVLEFEFCEIPNIASWDCSVADADVNSLSSLVEEPVAAVMDDDEDDPLKLPNLGCDLELHKPAALSPPRLEFRKDPHPSYLDNLELQPFSFDSFDRMESLVQAEDLGTGTLDILNDLDKELEGHGDLMLRPCHSF